MKVLVVDTYYQAFLRSAYEASPGLGRLPYEEQRAALLALRFGTSDFYSRNLRALGHEAEEVIANCEPLQHAWWREHRGRRLWRRPGLPEVLAAQVEDARPDVVYVQNVVWPPAPLLARLRASARLLCGQHATALPPSETLAQFELVVSSLPNVVEAVRAGGGDAAYLPLAFEASLLDEISPRTAGAVVHVGGYGPVHAQRNALLEAVAAEVEVAFFGYGLDGLPEGSQIGRGYRGEAWGLDMYAVRAGSRVTLTGHVDEVAGPYANNATLFEATGVGACLVTDRKKNLGELFEVDREVVAYASAEECVERVRRLLEHEDERRAIAAAGQARTLRDHTWARRMAELAELLEGRLRS